jgi:hypothetical protein
MNDGRPVLFSQELIPRGDLLFERKGTSRLVAVRKDGLGVVTHVFLDTMPHVAFERVGWHGQPGLHRIGFLVAIVLFLGAVAERIVRSIREHTTVVSADRHLLLTQALLLAESALGLAFLAGVGVGMSDPWEFQYGLPPFMEPILWMPMGMLVMVAASLGLLAVAWLRRWWTARRKIYFTGHLAGTMLFLTLLAYWNALGFRY